MDQLEQRLRDTFADDRLDVTVRSDAVDLVHSGVRRRRRNRQVVSVAAVVAVVAGGGAVVVATTLTPTSAVIVGPASPSPTPVSKPSAPQTTTTNVPWQNIGYDYTSPPAFPGAFPDPSVPWCKAGQLSITASFQGATGNSGGAVAIANTSSAPCAVQGEPGIRILDGSGHTLVSHVAETFFVYAWVKLTPGARASAIVEWEQEFCHEPAPATIQVNLPRDGGVLSAPMTFPPRCNAQSDPPNVGRLFVDGFTTDNAPTYFTPEAGLSATVTDAPRSAASGETITYHLQLANSGDASVQLSPCLPFRERLTNQQTGAVLVEEDHVLNCDDAPQSVDANEVLDFAIEIAVPTSATPGNYSLDWQSVLKGVHAVSDEAVAIGAIPACTDGQVVASLGQYGQTMAQYGQAVIFTNVSASACTLRGYPGIQLVDAAGKPLPKQPHRGGGFAFQDPPWQTVVLKPMTGKASFEFGGVAYDNAAQRPCAEAAGLRVIAPGQHDQTLIRAKLPYCANYDLAVAKVVAGTRGF